MLAPPPPKLKNNAFRPQSKPMLLQTRSIIQKIVTSLFQREVGSKKTRQQCDFIEFTIGLIPHFFHTLASSGEFTMGDFEDLDEGWRRDFGII